MYKICSRCLFRVQSSKIVCTTCGAVGLFVDSVRSIESTDQEQLRFHAFLKFYKKRMWHLFGLAQLFLRSKLRNH